LKIRTIHHDGGSRHQHFDRYDRSPPKRLCIQPGSDVDLIVARNDATRKFDAVHPDLLLSMTRQFQKTATIDCSDGRISPKLIPTAHVCRAIRPVGSTFFGRNFTSGFWKAE